MAGQPGSVSDFAAAIPALRELNDEAGLELDDYKLTFWQIAD
jgi:hypothetical protein